MSFGRGETGAGDSSRLSRESCIVFDADSDYVSEGTQGLGSRR
jgi:hypothetical protein